jgi:hypothetical protein
MGVTGGSVGPQRAATACCAELYPWASYAREAIAAVLRQLIKQN